MSLNQVSNQHLLFQDHLNDCIKMRTVFQGDKAIKANAKTYVPKNKGVSDEDYNAIIQNKDPKFLKVAENKLNIDETSAAFAKGNATYLVPFDILENTRTLPPDLGAYQSKTFPK